MTTNLDGEIKEELVKNIKLLKANLRSRSSESIIISKLQECPCSVKCIYDIDNPEYNNIDSLYSARHQYIRNKIIESLVERYGNKLKICSEFATNTGKLDIALLRTDKVEFLNDKKIIGIEIKSGQFTTISNLYQIERYLFSTDLLIVVRIPYQEVTAISIEEGLRNTLNNVISILNHKIIRLLNRDLIKVPGDWCEGCNCACEYKKPQRWHGKNLPSLEEYPDLIKNADLILPRLLKILERYVLEKSLN